MTDEPYGEEVETFVSAALATPFSYIVSKVDNTQFHRTGMHVLMRQYSAVVWTIPHFCYSAGVKSGIPRARQSLFQSAPSNWTIVLSFLRRAYPAPWSRNRARNGRTLSSTIISPWRKPPRLSLRPQIRAEIPAQEIPLLGTRTWHGVSRPTLCDRDES